MSIAMLVMWMWAHSVCGNVTGCSIEPNSATIITAPFLDVPAVQESAYHKGCWGPSVPYEDKCFGMTEVTYDGCNWCGKANGMYQCTLRGCSPDDHMEWTCTDKRRVLLTDESGKRHCILFGEAR